MAKKRIVHVVGCMVPGGGIESMILNLLREIDHSKYVFDFIYFTKENSKYDNEIKKYGGRIFHFPNNNISIIRQFVAWIKFCKNYPEYRLFHIHRCTPFFFITILLRLLGKKVILHSHDVFLEKSLVSFLYYPQRFFGNYFMACSNIAAISKFGRHIAKSAYCTIVKNGINSKIFRFSSDQRNLIRKELNLKEDTFLIGNVGRFVLEKNHSFLLDIFANILTIKPNSKLLLIGDGILRHEIEEKIKKLNLTNRVILLGVVNNVNELLNALDVFVLPSISEGLGIVAIEAQMNNLPTIVSDKIPIEANISSNFISIPLTKPANEWAKSIITISENHNRNISSFTKNFDISNTTKTVCSIYDKLL